MNQAFIQNEKQNLFVEDKSSCKNILCIGILITIGIILLISIIFTLIIGIKYSNLFIKSGYDEPWNDLYGNRTINIPYFKDDKISNTFKKGGDNYNNGTIGEINNGKDYDKNERNYYDLYIPYSSTKKKNKYNGIILFIHGGSWKYGDKSQMNFICSRYAKMGYITATMGYTLLDKYKDSNIFRILDEITSCIKSIKEELINQGFNETKLEIAIGGASAGAHLAMLYGYSIKKTPIPIKFIINFVGPVTLETDAWYKLNKKSEPLNTIEPKDIEDSIKNNTIVKMDINTTLLEMMNLFIGKKYKNKELKGMIKGKDIDNDNGDYKKLYEIVKNSFPINFINNDTVPTLCIYGGKDEVVGIAQYSKLKKLFEKNNNKIKLVYMKYGGHMLLGANTENGVHAMREMHFQILNFSSLYFQNDTR